VPPAPVFPRVLCYLSLGLSFYVCIICVGFGVYQYAFAGVPLYTSLGVDIQKATKGVRDDDDLAPVLAAVAAESRVSSSMFIAFGILLGYVSWVLPFEWKGIPHLSVALFTGLFAFSNHQFISGEHHWGFLVPNAATLNFMAIMRVVNAVMSMTFWVFAVMSVKMSYAAALQATAKRD